MFSSYVVYFILSALVSSDSVFGGVLECNDSSDCIDEASCIDNLCECDRGYVFSTNGDRCLTYSIGYGASCEDDTQCSWLMGKHYCNNGLCNCASGYIYMHGRCIEERGLGETCTTSAQCHVTNDIKSMVCSNAGICVCNEGYYVRGDYDCRPEITNLSSAGCSIDLDCTMEGAVCSGSTTMCTLESSETFYFESRAQANTKDARANEIGLSCTQTEDCDGYENSICSPLTSECVCERGYFYESTSGCVAEIGHSFGCTNAANCEHIQLSTCDAVEGACYCEKYAYHAADLTSCNRMARGTTVDCQNDNSCQLISPDATCVTNIIGSSVTRTCQCPLDYDLNLDNYLCEQRDTNDTSTSCGSEQCITVDTCTLVNAICLDRVCTCDTGYREEDNVCWPNIGTACDSNTALCEIYNADCVNSVCTCNEGYSALDETTCTPVISLYEDCEYDVECAGADENSACINGQCSCIDGYIDRDGQCLQTKGYGDYCINVSQCRVVFGENMQCRNSMCQCAADMVRTADGLDCTRSNASSIPRSLTLFISIFIILFSVPIYI